jgi:phosphatidylinositol-3-phosphatase
MVFENPDHGPGIVGLGGGRIGAVLLSPFIKPRTTSSVHYNHYSLLRSIEDFFAVGHLGYAGQTGLQSFGKEIFNQPKG